MDLKRYILIFLLLFTVLNAYAQQNRDIRDRKRYRNRPMPTDTNVVNRTVDPYLVNDSERTAKFYDSLRSKTTRRAVPSLLYHSIFRKRRDTTYTGQVVDEALYYEKYEGRTIGNIVIDRKDIYEDATRGSQKFLNKAHVMTRHKVVRRDLLFKSGDKLDPDEIVRNKHIILYRPYIGKVSIEVVPQEADSMIVDVHIYTMDKWTIGITGRFHSRGRTMIEVYDDNIFGTGNELGIQTSFDRRKFNYEGNGVEYKIPNILGSFYQADFYAGKYFYDEIFRANIRKDFIKPTDYMLGGELDKERLDYYMVYADSSDFVKFNKCDVWSGKSFHIKSINSSIYFTGRYNSAKYTKRPETTSTFNPAFHNRKTMLYGLGLYREKFYAANMIYGFGFQEYVASGYRFELVGGYNWGEFRNDYYAGVNFHQGDYHSFGYLRFDVESGTFINSKTGKWWQSAVDLKISWFSNLFHFRRSSMRQFLSFNHTRGWNRGKGNDEVIRFTRDRGPYLINQWIIGRTRMVINTETVFFTPFKPAGFRTAIFGWADFATLGNNRNMFKNGFYSTFGIGVRLKNERLTFSAIEFRLGMAVGKGGMVDSQYFKMSSERKMRDPRFIPTSPAVVDYE